MGIVSAPDPPAAVTVTKVTRIEWKDPKEEHPTFHAPILVLLGGSLRLPDGQWKRYVNVQHIVMVYDSPNDESQEEEYGDFRHGDASNFGEFQFYLCSIDSWRMGDFEDYLDWYSDAIVRWAAVPDFSSFMPDPPEF